jgi:lysophospholipase L1-like esterase
LHLSETLLRFREIQVSTDAFMTTGGDMTDAARGVGVLIFAACAALAASTLPGRAQQPAPERWVTAWGTSMQALGTNAVTNATVRLVARVTVAGDAVRIRLDNTFGQAPLRVGKAYVGLRNQAAGIVPGSNTPILFAGASSVSVPAGGTMVSDAVALKVLARQDLAVSLYIPDSDVRPTQHANAFTTSYITDSGAGDKSADEARMPFTATTTSMYWLKAIDVLSPGAPGAIVAFGDSITDGTCSTIDGNNRWADWLSLRMDLAGMPRAVVNEGIAGNTVTHENLQPPPDSPPGVERLERDVLSHHGVTHVVLFMGTNDIRREASAAQVMAGISDIVKRVKARGLKVVGVTIIPRHNAAPTATNTGWNAAKTRIRNDVNQWIRKGAGFDGVIDFDQVVRDPSDPDLMAPAFNCGDGIHPSVRGYYEMGKLLDLKVF